ncbi:hypothetical protein B296_00035113, partial [Ensete ventricosum]
IAAEGRRIAAAEAGRQRRPAVRREALLCWSDAAEASPLHREKKTRYSRSDSDDAGVRRGCVLTGRGGAAAEGAQRRRRECVQTLLLTIYGASQDCKQGLTEQILLHRGRVLRAQPLFQRRYLLNRLLWKRTSAGRSREGEERLRLLWKRASVLPLEEGRRGLRLPRKR